MRDVQTISLKIILLAGIIFTFGCDDNKSVNSGDHVSNTDFTAEEEFLFELDAAHQSAFRLEAINSSISITGRADFDSVIIAGLKRVGSESTEDAEAHLEYLDIGIQELSDEIFVKTLQPDETLGRNYEVLYEITIPDDFEISVTNINGGVAVDSIYDHIIINNINGPIDLDEVSGNILVSLVNGQIEASAVLPLDGSIIMSTVNGGVALEIPESTSADFEASWVNGGISIVNLTLHNQEITSHSVSGTLGDGDGNISLSTVNGNISARGF